MGKFIDLTGQRFGKLIVQKRLSNTKYGSAIWLCRCDCGNEVEAIGSNLRSGKHLSCGCLKLQKAIERISSYNKIHASQRNKRIFRIWVHMRQRCENPKSDSYVWYGMRGISVCDDWHTFENFEQWALKNGYAPNLTIDRIDVNGDYTPKNCRWITMKEQAYNRRDNQRLSFNGKTLTITEWARLLGCSYTCIYYRIKAGWPLSEVLSTPSHRKNIKIQ